MGKTTFRRETLVILQTSVESLVLKTNKRAYKKIFFGGVKYWLKKTWNSSNRNKSLLVCFLQNSVEPNFVQSVNTRGWWDTWVEHSYLLQTETSFKAQLFSNQEYKRRNCSESFMEWNSEEAQNPWASNRKGNSQIVPVENHGTAEQRNETAGKPPRQWQDRQKISTAVYEIMWKIREEGRSCSLEEKLCQTGNMSGQQGCGGRDWFCWYCGKRSSRTLGWEKGWKKWKVTWRLKAWKEKENVSTSKDPTVIMQLSALPL